MTTSETQTAPAEARQREGEFDRRYQALHGVAAGYLPRRRGAVDEWHEELTRTIEDIGLDPKDWPPSVKALDDLLKTDEPLRKLVNGMISDVPEEHQHGIKEIKDLLDRLAHIVTSPVAYNWDPAKRNFFPLSTLFVYMMFTEWGWDAFRDQEFNNALRKILQAWYDFLNSEKSAEYLNDKLPDGWLSQPAYEQLKLYEFDITPTPSSFNAFFHRQIKREQFRPVSGPTDPQVIVSSNDGTVVRWAQVTQASDEYYLKGQPYSLTDMLTDPGDPDWKPGDYVQRFVGGHVYQSFLSGADYHRWWTPIAGTVVEAPRVIPGLMFSELRSAGMDPSAGTQSQGYQASVNTRGLLLVESDFRLDDGKKMLVGFLPIGITEISSVAFLDADGQPITKGQRLAKGEEIGRFSYGGSSVCLIFSKGVIKQFDTPPNNSGDMDAGPPIFAGMRIATTNHLTGP
ncbi:phophatidylserine decarboxylase associated domain-containing protein [Kitasatospora sp. NPDC057541]|uniref:phophatidylserine decarboxylase associated domain-containing protein n=1 Tax=unclassified Kitasatospora TaxID=2633591 RepID=UPI0036B39853